MSTEIVRELVNGEWVTTVGTGGGGGGSQPFAVVRVPIAFDTPGLEFALFAITAVNQGAQSFTIAGDHAADYPAGVSFDVSGSTGNDGGYTVVSSTFGAGSTVIVTVEAISDATADGAIESPPLPIYVPEDGDLFIGWLVTIPSTAWDGTTPNLDLGLRVDSAHYGNGAIDATDSATGSGDTTLAILAGGSIVGGSSMQGEILHADAVTARVTDGSGGSPGSTQGEGEILLFIVPAGS